MTDIDTKISSSIIHLLNSNEIGGEYYAHFISQAIRVYDESIPAPMGVGYNKGIRLYINPKILDDYLKGIPEEVKNDDPNYDRDVISTILAHEALHLIYNHPQDFKYFDSKFPNPKRLNIAMDLVINSGLNKKYLPGGWFPEDHNLESDQIVDYYYENLPECPKCKEKEESNNNKKGEGKEGSGDKPQSNVCDSCASKSHVKWEELTEKEKELVKEALKEMMNTAANRCQDPGNIPDNIKDIINTLNKPSILPWGQYIRKFTASCSRGDLKYTKRRLSKRFGTRPSPKIKRRQNILVAQDVSGSITNETYIEFYREIFGLARLADIEVLEWDVEIQDIKEIKGYTPNITRNGNGGTCPKKAIEYINENKNKYDGVIFMTDGYLFEKVRKKDIQVPTVWVVTPDGQSRDLEGFQVVKMPCNGKD